MTARKSIAVGTFLSPVILGRCDIGRPKGRWKNFSSLGKWVSCPVLVGGRCNMRSIM